MSTSPDRRFYGVLALLTLLAVAPRAWLATRMGTLIDEPASALAAHQVLKEGLPILPSGTLYLQGALLSYLMAPIIALGKGAAGDIASLRAVSVVFGALTVPLIGGWARAVSGRAWVGWLAAAMIAVDASSLQWSAAIRPYGALQLMSVLAMVGAIAAARGSWVGAAMSASALFLGTFSHIAIVATWGALLVATVAVYRKHPPAPLAAAAGSGVLGPLVFLGINRAFGVTSSGSSDTKVGFVGDHILSLEQVLHPDLGPWHAMYYLVESGEIAIALTAASGALVAWNFLVAPPPEIERRFATAALLLAGFTPIAAIAAFAQEAAGRYLLHGHTAALVWVPVAVGLTWYAPTAAVGWRRLAALVLCFGVGAVGIGAGLARLRNTVVDKADYGPAFAYINGHHKPGEPILVAMPPVAWWVLRDQADVVFLAGPKGGVRAERYTRQVDGRAIDWWIGYPAVTSTSELCAYIEQRPDAWIAFDMARKTSKYAYAGAMSTVLGGATRPLWNQPGGVRVARSLPRESWSAEARRVCPRAGTVEVSPPPPPDEEGDSPMYPSDEQATGSEAQP